MGVGLTPWQEINYGRKPYFPFEMFAGEILSLPKGRLEHRFSIGKLLIGWDKGDGEDKEDKGVWENFLPCPPGPPGPRSPFQPGISVLLNQCSSSC